MPTTKRHRVLSVQNDLLRRCIAVTAGAFLLAGLQFRGHALPIAACLIGALPIGLSAVFAALGAICGYLIAFGVAESAEFLALSALVLAALTVFQGTPLAAHRLFLPCLTAGVCAVLGSVRLLGGSGDWLLWSMQVLCAATVGIVFRSAVCGNVHTQLIPVILSIAGATTILPLFEPSLLGAVALSAWTLRLLPAAAVAAALELFSGGVPSVAVILIPTLVCQLPRIRHQKTLCALVFTVLPCLTLFLCGSLTMARCFAVFGGALLGSVLRLRGIPTGVAEDTQQGTQEALQNAAEVLELLRDQLPKQTLPPSVSEAESVYDGAAERVCRCCARFHRCWQRHAAETYAALTGAARSIIENGIASAEDFPQEFRENCCHLEGFVTAVNGELEGMLYRRRYHMERSENQQLMAEEFGCLAEYLRAECERLLHEPRIVPAYLPELGAYRVGKNGSRTCGDRGAGFRGRHGDFYVLLCDGMGTGPAAAETGAQTVKFLERLLKSGIAPESALKILNGAEILCGSGRFTTIDLLHLDLTSGDCTLFKWGSAPSYWRTEETVKKIGTSAPPPGVGVGGGNQPERYQMSLARGEMLVLTSDGAGEAQTEAAISAYSGDSARELAALLVSELPAEDDVSAVVVALRPCASHPL